MVLASLLITLKIFYNFFQRFHCWFWAGKCLLVKVRFCYITNTFKIVCRIVCGISSRNNSRHVKHSGQHAFSPHWKWNGVKNVHFMKIWRALFSCYIHFENSLFALLPTMTDLVRNTELPQIIWVNKHFHRQYTCIEICEINIIKIEWMKVACIFFWDKNGL